LQNKNLLHIGLWSNIALSPDFDIKTEVIGAKA